MLQARTSFGSLTRKINTYKITNSYFAGFFCHTAYPFLPVFFLITHTGKCYIQSVFLSCFREELFLSETVL